QIGVALPIGTSGTLQALTALASPPDQQNTSALRALKRDALEETVRTMSTLSASERVSKLGLDEKRARNILAGGLVVCEFLGVFDLASILACPVAIREGIIESTRTVKRNGKVQGSSLRRKSVLALADRSACDRRHAQHVARLARRIFNQTRDLHRLTDESAEMLEHAAILHESGMHVSDRGYHKHTYYLIRHADLRGFTEEQLLVVANVPRDHRKARPGEDDENLIELNDVQRDEVEKLSAILRIAEGLDRSHRQSVRDIAVRANGQVKFVVRARSDAASEIASAAKRAKYFAEL